MSGSWKRAAAALAAAAAVGAAAPPGARAQAPLPAPGDVVRVSSPGAKRQVGSVLYADADSVTIQPRRGGAAVAVPLAGATRLDVHRGRAPAGDGFLRGAGIGFVAGAVTGAAFALEFCSDGFCDGSGGTEGTAIQGAAAFGVAGALVGGAIGAVLPGARWERLRVPAVAPAAGGGAAVALSLRL